MRRLLLTFALLSTLPATAQAAERDVTTLHLSASAQQELSNDEITASLYIQERQAQAAQLADRINKTLNRAKADAAAFRNVEFASGSYNTWPDYDKGGKIAGWQARAEVKIKSRDFAEAAELVARLQKYLALENVQFAVSDSSRRAAETQLIPQAIAAMQQQAAAAAKALGRQQQRVVELRIGQGQPHFPMPLRAKAEMMSAASADVTRPDWQPGNSTIQLQVDGQIELQ